MCLISIATLPFRLNKRSVGVAKQPSDQDIERIFLTFTEAQKFLGVSHQTIYKLMKDGVPSHKIGKKRVFLKEDLVKWIKEH
jgi:excisionase family DNA binding protein